MKRKRKEAKFMNDNFDKILDVLNKYSNLGQETITNGTQLIGRALHIAPKAWLHQIYPPLKNEEISLIETKLKILIPNEFRDFLEHHSNGLNIFSNSLSIYGLRKNYIRDIINVWQPFDILTPNMEENICEGNKKILFIGSYKQDGSLLYIDLENNKVYRSNKDSIKPINEWVSFYNMLLSETKRIDTFLV